MLLSRVAESLFWLGRHVERAENTARLLDVTYHGRLEPSASEVAGATNTWPALITTLGLVDRYQALYDGYDELSVIEFLTVSRDNDSSIISSLGAARENARSVRDYLSSESWVSLNRLYHSTANTNIHLILADGLYDFCDSVRVGSHLFAGTVRATSLYDEGMQWLWTGAYLERSDMITRLVDSKYHLLMNRVEEIGGPIDRFQWMALLRSVSGWEAYLRLHPAGVDPSSVVEFLMLNPIFPRSLRTSIDSLQRALSEATAGAAVQLRNHPMRSVSELQSRLQFESAETLIGAGLHEYVANIQLVLAYINASVSDCFFWADHGAA
jgi:uncharacterized alpha-E superfamily protein